MSNQGMDMTHIRAEANKVLERAKSDPKFREQLFNDPRGALKEAGFPSEAIEPAASELTANLGDVSGYVIQDCTSTVICDATCSTTIYSLPPRTA